MTAEGFAFGLLTVLDNINNSINNLSLIVFALVVVATLQLLFSFARGR